MGKISKKLQKYQVIFETTIGKIDEMESCFLDGIKHDNFVQTYDLLKKEKGWPSKCPIQFIGCVANQEDYERWQYRYIFKCQKSKTMYFIGIYYCSDNGLNTNMSPRIVNMKKVTYLQFEDNDGCTTDISESECENIQ